MTDLVVGVDLGGTNVRACVYDPQGVPATEAFSQPSRAQEGVEPVLDALAEVIQRAMATAPEHPRAVGIAIPGHIDNATGVVRWAPNFGKTVDGVFRYWLDVPIREPLQRRIALPIAMDNDANMAALGEYRFGTGRNQARGLVMFTLGTGVGGGVVLAPQCVLGDARGPLILIGGNTGGAELGHMCINEAGVECNAGTYGAVESYCQRDAIIRRAQHQLRRGRKSLLNDLCEGDLSKISPRLISEAAAQGDEVAIEVFAEVGRFLGIAIANMINVFAPEVVAVGGQIAKAGELILGPARQSARKVAVPQLYDFAQIVQAEQIEDAGMLGAAALAQESLKWNR